MYQSDVRTMHHVITFASPYYTMLRYIMLCAVTYIDLVKRMVTLTSTSLSLINYRYDDQATAAAKVLKILTIIMVVGRALTMDCKFLSSSSYWPSWGGHWSLVSLYSYTSVVDEHRTVQHTTYNPYTALKQSLCQWSAVMVEPRKPGMEEGFSSEAAFPKNI